MNRDELHASRLQDALAKLERAESEYRRATNAQRLAFAQLQNAHEELRAATGAPTPKIRLADEEMTRHECEA